MARNRRKTGKGQRAGQADGRSRKFFNLFETIYPDDEQIYIKLNTPWGLAAGDGGKVVTVSQPLSALSLRHPRAYAARPLVPEPVPAGF